MSVKQGLTAQVPDLIPVQITTEEDLLPKDLLDCTLFSPKIVETEHLPLRAAILLLKCTEGAGIGSTFPHFLSVLYTHPQAILGK